MGRGPIIFDAGTPTDPMARRRADVQAEGARFGLWYEARHKVDGVFQGGGALGSAYPGALLALEANNLWFSRVAGTSAGAITAAMVAAGFTAAEILALSSAYDGHDPMPQSLLDLGIDKPIRFLSFLDLPTKDTLSQASKRNTMLWQALNGTVLDYIADRVPPLPIPTTQGVVDTTVNAILAHPDLGGALRTAGLDGVIRDVLRDVFDFLPDNPINPLQYIMNSTAASRRNFADDVWDKIADIDPFLAPVTNLLNEGGLLEGRVFRETFAELLAKKLPQAEGGIVRFRDLPIPLAVIATDVNEGAMIVYSSETHENLSVAEAVRQSMSLPIIFEPRRDAGGNRRYHDGGLISNFPVWLYGSANEATFWPAGSIASRPVVGMTLDDKTAASGIYGYLPAPRPVIGNPPRIDVDAETRDMLADMLDEHLRPILESEVRPRIAALGLSPAETEDRIVAELEAELAIMIANTIDGTPELFLQMSKMFFNGALRSEDELRAFTNPSVLGDKTFLDVSVPLLGYGSGDFGINSRGNGDDLKGMMDRGWQAMIDALIAARNANQLDPVLTIQETNSPFPRNPPIARRFAPRNPGGPIPPPT